MLSKLNKDVVANDVLVFYEQLMKILNIRLYYKNIKTDTETETDTKTELNKYYKKCEYQHRINISSNTPGNPKIHPIQSIIDRKQSIFPSMKSMNINNNTMIEDTQPPLYLGELKQKIASIASNKDSDIQSKNKLYTDLSVLKLIPQMYNNKINITHKKYYKLIKYIFDGHYDLMLGFIEYNAYINFALIIKFLDIKDIRKKIDVGKIYYRIRLSTLIFIRDNLNIQDLTTLDLRKNNINDNIVVTELIKALQSITLLTKFDISRNKIGDIGVEALVGALKDNTTLITFNISDNNIGDSGIIHLSKLLPTIKTLTTLDINSNNITNVGAKALADAYALQDTTTLITLNISKNKIDEDGLIVLITNIGLITLIFNENEIGRNRSKTESNKILTGANLEKTLAENITLKTLNISASGINNSIIGYIAVGLKKNKHLTTLGVSNNIIGNEGAKALALALGENGNRTLTTLNLNNNQIKIEGLEAFSKVLDYNKIIETINLEDNITEEYITEEYGSEYNGYDDNNNRDDDNNRYDYNNRDDYNNRYDDYNRYDY